MDLFGVPRWIAVPVAAVVVWLLVVRGNFRNVEKVLLALSSVFTAYVIAAFLARRLGRSRPCIRGALVVPTQAFVALAIGLTGTTIAPWMQFLVQSNIADKGTTIKEWAFARWTSSLGPCSPT